MEFKIIGIIKKDENFDVDFDGLKESFGTNQRFKRDIINCSEVKSALGGILFGYDFKLMSDNIFYVIELRKKHIKGILKTIVYLQ